MRCENCQRELASEDAVIIWYRQRQDIIGVGYAQTRGCESCVDEAINAEHANRGFSVRAALRLLRGEPPITVRGSWCDRCKRVVYIVTATPYKDAYYVRSTYCSDHCRAVERTARQQIACEVCGASFTPKRSDAKTCSSACRQRAYRSRRYSSNVR